jgi:hypothetical protein
METIGKIILGFLSGILEIFIRDIIFGFFGFVFNSIAKVLKNIFGVKYEENSLKLIEKKYLYKNVVLIENLNEKLKSGLKGAVLEIIDEENAIVEFYAPNSTQQIEYESELAFKVNLKQIKLLK